MSYKTQRKNFEGSMNRFARWLVMLIILWRIVVLIFKSLLDFGTFMQILPFYLLTKLLLTLEFYITFYKDYMKSFLLENVGVDIWPEISFFNVTLPLKSIKSTDLMTSKRNKY